MSHSAKDFLWTWADRQAGFPALRAALAATDTAILQETYAAQMRACFGIFGRNACVLQNEIARELLSRGVATIPNLFGPMAIVTTWGKETS
jgi:hypothetical protein